MRGNGPGKMMGHLPKFDRPPRLRPVRGFDRAFKGIASSRVRWWLATIANEKVAEHLAAEQEERNEKVRGEWRTKAGVIVKGERS